jgi:sugar-phosphatase
VRTPPFAASALLLDMDGLLVDSEPLWFVVEQEFARDRGGEWTAAHAAECVGRGMANTLTTMGHTFGFAVDLAHDAVEIVQRFVARVTDLAPKPGALELLEQARGRVPLALASSSPQALIDAVLAHLGVREAFRTIVSGERVEHPKPAPDIFLRAAKDLGTAPDRCIVLEDSPAGCAAGRAAGATVIAVPEGPWQGRGFEPNADAIVGDLFEARALLVF